VFIGAGNMGEALVRGILKSGLCPPTSIMVTDVWPERIAFFQKTFGVGGSKSNREAVKNADVVVLAVKPQTMSDVLGDLKDAIGQKTLVISIAAGITIARLESQLGDGFRVVRVMPNTPALVQAGAAALCGGRWATEADLQVAERLMGAVGLAVRVKESDIDAVTALSGSGPAYVFYFIEAMLDAARRMNLDERVARQLVYATVGGAAKLITETGVDAAELRQRVTSKGGTTAAAVEVLESRKVADAWVEAVLAAQKRSRELSAS